MGKEVPNHYWIEKRYRTIREASDSAAQKITVYQKGEDGEVEERYSEENIEHESYYETVRDGLKDIDRNIQRKKVRKPEELPDLYEIKNTMVLLALQLRRDGEERIRVKMRDDSSTPVDGYKKGVMKISFLDNAAKEVNATFVNLPALTSRFNDLPHLIGKPDGNLFKKRPH